MKSIRVAGSYITILALNNALTKAYRLDKLRTHNNDMYVVSDSPEFINSLDKTFVQSYHGGHIFSPVLEQQHLALKGCSWGQEREKPYTKLCQKIQ